MGGFNYVLDDKTNKIIKIYNINHRLLVSIPIPTIVTSLSNIYSIGYISDNLFDANPDIEYVLNANGNGTVFPRAFVFKDNGTQVFYKDSASVSIN